MLLIVTLDFIYNIFELVLVFLGLRLYLNAVKMAFNKHSFLIHGAGVYRVIIIKTWGIGSRNIIALFSNLWFHSKSKTQIVHAGVIWYIVALHKVILLYSNVRVHMHLELEIVLICW